MYDINRKFSHLNHVAMMKRCIRTFTEFAKPLEQNVLIIIYVLHERFSGCIHLNATMLRSDRTFGRRSVLMVGTVHVWRYQLYISHRLLCAPQLLRIQLYSATDVPCNTVKTHALTQTHTHTAQWAHTTDRARRSMSSLLDKLYYKLKLHSGTRWTHWRL